MFYDMRIYFSKNLKLFLGNLSIGPLLGILFIHDSHLVCEFIYHPLQLSVSLFRKTEMRRMILFCLLSSDPELQNIQL